VDLENFSYVRTLKISPTVYIILDLVVVVVVAGGGIFFSISFLHFISNFEVLNFKNVCQDIIF